MALVQHLEVVFEDFDLEADLARVEALIGILERTPVQSEAKITSYTKCLRVVVDQKLKHYELVGRLFDLVESLVDPG